MEREEVFVDEFNISSHRDKFRGWAQKNHKPIIASTLDNFSMYFVITVSSKHIYGVLASEQANTSQILLYFLDCLIKCQESLFKQTNEKTLFVIDNASIHKTKSIDEYVKSKEISLLTIPPYSLALNGAETVIQSIESKVSRHRSYGR